MKKLISLILSIIVVFVFSSCSCSEKKDMTQVTDDIVTSKVTNTLHKVNVTESNRKFISGGKTEYKIVVVDSAAEALTAANFIKTHLKNATKVELSVLTYSDSESCAYSSSAKNIYIGKNAEFEKAGLSMPTDDLATSGYYIKSAGDSVFIVTKSQYGYQMGAIAFLREVVGYDMYCDNLYSYDRTPSTLPDMDIIERPDFDYRHWSNPLTTDEMYGMGYSLHADMITVGDSGMHNTFNWLPPETYMESHSKWYSDDQSQLCYTAHGDSEEYEAMQNEIFEKMKVYLADNPNVNTISISQEDVDQYCKCSTCSAELEKYGTMSAVTIKFLNDISDKLDKYLTEQAEENGTEKREFFIIQFAYQWTFSAPVTQDADGNWVAVDDSVVCNDNVGIEIAPLNAKYTRSIYSDENKYFKESIEKWSVITNNIYFWWYETDFSNYMYPYNCWDKMVEQYRFCVQQSTRYMFNEGQLGQSNGTGFTKLKDYIDSKALFDVNVETSDIIDKFFDGYFMDASEPMREYFDELQTYLTYLQETYPEILSGSIYENISKTEDGVPMFWKRKTMTKYLEYMDKAYEAIEKYKDIDTTIYNTLYDNITIETLFPRYILCKYYGGTFSTEEITKMRKEFKSDCERLGVTYELEHNYMSVLFDTWGV